MSIEHTRALVDAACAIPGVREKLPADWFWPYCPTCKGACDFSTAPERNNESVIICMVCKCDVAEPELRFEPDTQAGSPHMIWGPDFADKRNLWAMLEVSDAICCTMFGMSIGGAERDNPERKYVADLMVNGGWIESYSSDRITACRKTLATALGVPYE